MPHPSTDLPPLDRIPKAVVRRLALYARALGELDREHVEKVSSDELSRRIGHKPAQVRKDLALFGQFGTPGFGYPVSELHQSIQRILGKGREHRACVVGVGKLGGALLAYRGFARAGYQMVCGFDSHPGCANLTGDPRIPVYPITELEHRLQELDIEIAILTVPPEAAIEVAARLTRSRIRGILSFVPVRIDAPPHVHIRQVDLSLELESLGFYLNTSNIRPEPPAATEEAV
jgi:redox-sensing transcriptional repressor